MIEHATSQSPATLDDDKLVRRVVSLIGNEREILVEFLRHLAEVDARRLYLAQGFPSLFVYCRDLLHLSDGSAYRRYTSARLLRRFPAIAEHLLRSKELTLSKLVLLKVVLTQENHEALLEQATHASERDVARLVAGLKPKPDVKDSIRRVPVRAASADATAVCSERTTEPSAVHVTSADAARVDWAPLFAPSVPHAACTEPSSTRSAPLSAPSNEHAATANAALTCSTRVPAWNVPSADVSDGLVSSAGAASAPVPAAVPHARPAPASEIPPATHAQTLVSPRAARMKIEPTSAESFAVRMRVGPEFLADFEAARAALSHKIPDGNYEAVLRECMRIALETLQRRRAGAAKTRAGEMKTRAGANSTAAPANDAPASATPTPTQEVTAQPARKQSRYIPAVVLRAVWHRDQSRCAFVSNSGKRCGSTHQLQVHHLHPYARGGAATIDNLSLRCRQHNLYEAELDFGADFMRSLPIWKCEDSRVPNLLLPDEPPRDRAGVH